MRLVLAVAVILAACNPMTFNANNPGATHSSRSQPASRVTSDSGCTTLGTLTFDSARDGRDIDPLIESIARRVADEGGDSYIIREREVSGRRGKSHPASAVIVVLSCDGGGTHED